MLVFYTPTWAKIVHRFFSLADLTYDTNKKEKNDLRINQYVFWKQGLCEQGLCQQELVVRAGVVRARVSCANKGCANRGCRSKS